MRLPSVHSYSLARYNVLWEEKISKRRHCDTHVSLKDVRASCDSPSRIRGEVPQDSLCCYRVPLRYSLFLSPHPVTVAVKPIVKAALALRPEVLSPVMA